MATIRVSGPKAWQSALKGPATRWLDHVDRFSSEIADVAHSPKFNIGRDDSFFCIGSCFARNIEEHLIYRGVNVLSRRIICPKNEWPNRVNGIVNKFTTHSMRNEIDWVINPPVLDASMFEQQEAGWQDLQLCPGVGLVSLDRAIERRAYLISQYFTRIRSASVVVLTLGLNEAWFDGKTGRHLNAPPSFYAARRDPNRYELHITDVSDNVAELEKIRKLIMTANPSVKIIVTVSPVPMSETFSGIDVMIANMRSKSTLRAAADLFVQSFDNTDYFPSYDIVSMSPRNLAYGADCLHVSDKVVGHLMQKFMSLYLGFEPAVSDFSEIAYLEANPDVEDAVRRGEIDSGFEHWLRFGQSEGRPMRPPGDPTALMRAAAVV